MLAKYYLLHFIRWSHRHRQLIYIAFNGNYTELDRNDLFLAQTGIPHVQCYVSLKKNNERNTQKLIQINISQI